MILQELKIEIERWGENKGQYKGAAKFGDERGEVSLNLSSEHIDQIFSVCANGIIETAKRAASDMTCKIIEQAGVERHKIAEDVQPDTLLSRISRALTRTSERQE
ncbi:MAG TPA: hypothetical protein VN731_10350 [Rhodanobacter sp.]|nr:hypothetical protein [Rhodanobacter sp.]